MTDSTVNFSVLCEMLDAISRSKKAVLKRKHLRTFLEHVYTGRQYFSAIRLLLPVLDRERKAYKLKETQLAKNLINALALSKNSEDAQRLLNWRKGGAKAGPHAGNFSFVAAEILSRRQQSATGGLTIREVNELLDKLAEAESSEDKTSILAELINNTNATEMKWILMIILKDLKMGISEKSLFNEFHPDAEDMFNCTCDLKLVCETLKDKNERYKRQDIEVGKAVRAQLASRVSDVEAAWKKFHGKQVVVECKFDGDRIQVHKNGKEVHYFSRNFYDHKEYEHGMSGVILENVAAEKCILDGEMLVWDTNSKKFADFGTNQEIAKAVREGLHSNLQLCYVVFDILYVGDSSVIHQGLRERHQLLSKFVVPVKGQLELLLPQDGLEKCRLSGENCRSFVARNAQEVNEFFKYTVENRNEGVVLKDFDSKWEPGDRSGKWIKLKPDYVDTGSDLDALIIGGYFGSGRKGGEVAQFLLGLAEKSTSGGYPTRFVSFCRVGTGLSDDESGVLVNKLKPHLRRNDKLSSVPSFYTVTNNSKERPDVWIDRPEKSVILEITSDVRMINSEVFAAPYSLRFPRISRVRYDKPWYECLDVQSFVDLVQSRSGNYEGAKNNFEFNQHKPRRVKQTSRGDHRMLTVVPSHMLMTDVSSVQKKTSIFNNMIFYFVNLPPEYSIDQLHQLVAKHGGTSSMNLNVNVTRTIAADKRGIKYQAASKHGDVIHYSWLIDCDKLNLLQPLLPKYYLSLSDISKEKMKDDIDAFGDPYFLDLDISDLKQLFTNLENARVPEAAEANVRDTEKYCPDEKWGLYKNCRVYFHRTIHSTNEDSQIVAELTLRRLKMEVLMHGGLVTSTLGDATYVIVYSTSEYVVPYNFFLSSLSTVDRRVLERGRAYVLNHEWVEDSIEVGYKLSESDYQLKGDNSNEEPTFVENIPTEIDESNLEIKKTTKESGKRKAEQSSSDRTSEHKTLRPPRNKRQQATRRRGKGIKYFDSSEECNVIDQKTGHDVNVLDENPEESIERHRKRMNSDTSDEQNMNKQETIVAQTAGDNNKRQKIAGDGENSLEDEKAGYANSNNANAISNDENNRAKAEFKVPTEITTDPLEAMLADILPNYSFKNSSSKESSGPSQNNRSAQTVTTVAPEKKKVSYKDIVAQLLDEI